MEAVTPGLGQMLDASRRVAQRSLDIGANRVELFVVELHEERQRLMRSVVLALGVACLGVLGGFAFTLTVMVALWEYSPILPLAVLTVLYLIGAAVLVTKLVHAQKNWQMFSATLDQLQKDRECIASTFQ